MTADLQKARSMMNYAIEAIGNGQLAIDSWVHDRDDFGREFRLGQGLGAGIAHFHDDFVGPQREYVIKAYKAVGAGEPRSWVKSEVCADLLKRLGQSA